MNDAANLSTFSSNDNSGLGRASETSRLAQLHASQKPGAKYVAGRTHQQLKALILADIKAAGIKATGRIPVYSMANSIVIAVRVHGLVGKFTRKLLTDRVEAIAAEYNYDRSDSMTDYYCAAFMLSVHVKGDEA